MNQFNFNQSEIMSRVIFLHRLKRFWASPWSKLLLLASFFGAEYSLVSIHNVIINLWHTNNLASGSEYFLSALMHTHYLAQILLGGLVLSAFWFAIDSLRSWRTHRHLATV